MKTTIKLEGFKELERALAEDLPKATARNVLKRTAMNANKRIEDKAKELSPVDDGALRDRITTKPVKAQRISRTRFARSTGVAVATGPTGREEGGYGAFQEFGTVNMPANPFMLPAAHSEGQKVIAEVRDELKTQVEKAKARIARKLAKKG